MPFTIELDESLRLIRAVMTGRFDAKRVEEMVTAAREAAQARGWDILYDMREAHPDPMGLGELFWIPRRLPVLQSPGAAQRRVALLHGAEAAGLARYWEDTFRNAGLDARAFVEETGALAWLGSSRDPGDGA